MLNSNGRVWAADGFCERELKSDVKQCVQIRNWSTIYAAGASIVARRKRNSLSCPEYLACSYSIPLSNFIELPLVHSSFSVGDTIRWTAPAATRAFRLRAVAIEQRKQFCMICLACHIIRHYCRNIRYWRHPQMGEGVKERASCRVPVHSTDFSGDSFCCSSKSLPLWIYSDSFIGTLDSRPHSGVRAHLLQKEQKSLLWLHHWN